MGRAGTSRANRKVDLRRQTVSDDTTQGSNREKDVDQWVTQDEPMTGAQASYLKTLSEEAKAPEAFDPELDKAEASKRIDDLRHKAGHA
jgi:hypothetical protein